MEVANAAQADPLPSWNDTAAKRSVLSFVRSVTEPNGPDYVPPAARIAVFDNDGTLWSEQPLYIQLAFALDRVKALAPEHPEWRTTQPFQPVLENDTKALGAAGVKGLLEMVVATHAGMTTDEFERIGKAWFASAKHPLAAPGRIESPPRRIRQGDDNVPQTVHGSPAGRGGCSGRDWPPFRGVRRTGP